jgi:hypothetical protein
MNLGEVGWDDVYYISLAQDRDKWRALVNLVMNFRVQYIFGKLSSIPQVVASRIVLSSIELVRETGW